jgi:hypothetical protein
MAPVDDQPADLVGTDQAQVPLPLGWAIAHPIVEETLEIVGTDAAGFVPLAPLPDAEYGAQVKMRAEAADILENGFAQLTKVANAPQGVQSGEKNSSR